MKKVIIYMFAISLLISCKKNSFDFVSKYSESVPRMELKRSAEETQLPGKFFKEGQLNYFYPAYNIFVSFDIVNQNEQTIENLSIYPTLRLTFKSDSIIKIPLKSKTFSNLSFKTQDTISLKNLFRLDTIPAFNIKYFLHDVDKAEVYLNIKAKNSIGLSIREAENKESMIDVTKSWNELKKFSSKNELESIEQVLGSYPVQLALLQNDYNEHLAKYNATIDNWYTNNLRPDYYDRDRVSKMGWIHNRYKELLWKILNKYVEDLKKSNGKITPQFESLINEYQREYTAGLVIREKIFEKVDKSILSYDFFSKNEHKEIDSLRVLSQIHINTSVKFYSNAMKELGEKNKIRNMASKMKEFDKNNNLK